MGDFLEQGLNPEQIRAMKATDGPVLILAGAGSGKTKTLTHRLAYLMSEKGIAPHNIMAVTFTNKASQEMKERIATLLKNMPQDKQRDFYGQSMPKIGTFHALCASLLRQEIEVLGYEKNFTVFDDQDQLSLMKRVMKEHSISTEQINPRSLLNAISKAKNDLLTEDEFALSTGSYYEEMAAKAYSGYQKELRRAGALDFDDLIFLTVRLLRDSVPVLEKYQELFRYIMVDEYQDTNHSQYMLITLLAKKHRNVFVIGDDYQSIYGWRQADIRNILDFEKDYPEAAIITLDQNYRSTQTILDAAGGIILRNENQRHKKMWTNFSRGDAITVFSARDEREEAEYVAREITRSVEEKKRPFSDYAILYRTNAQSRIMEEALLRHSIPYRVIGGMKFYQRKEVKDSVAYLRLLSNARDTLALERIINEPKRGLGKVSLAAWFAYADRVRRDSMDCGLDIDGKTAGMREVKAAAIRKFCSVISDARVFLEKADSLAHAIEHILTVSDYMKSLDDGTDESATRKENVKELLSVAKKYDGRVVHEALSAFLEEIALASDTDSIDRKQPAVHLMTIHSSKGLEFPIIFVIGLEEGIFPHSRSAFSSRELEEERRLMYVALTRAKEKVHLLFADQRTLYGSTQINPVSRFVDEIPKHLIQKERLQHSDATLFAATSHTQKRKTKLFSKTMLRPGDSIEHPDFGRGLVVGLVGSLATIAFKQKGLKKIDTLLVTLKKI